MGGIVVIVSGLPDLVTALAALRRHGVCDAELRRRGYVLLLGHQGSLSDELCSVVRRVTRHAYGIERIGLHRWENGAGALPEAIAAAGVAPLVAGNHLQALSHREAIAAFGPEEFLFFDNGLSSYADHRVPVAEWLAAIPTCKRAVAYLTHRTRFGAPAYLSPFEVMDLPAADLREAAAPIRTACIPADAQLGDRAAIIIGTSFCRMGLVSPDDERAAHLRLLQEVRARHNGPIHFKAHPRASVALLSESDGVAVMDAHLPVEAFISGPGGAAYSFTSTCLFTLEDQFAWRTFRASHPAMDVVLEARMQLAKMASMQVTLPLSGEP